MRKALRNDERHGGEESAALLCDERMELFLPEHAFPCAGYPPVDLRHGVIVELGIERKQAF